MLLPKKLLHFGLVLTVCLTDAFWQNGKSVKKDSCFCHLSGQVDDCCCSIEDVAKLNLHIYPRLTNLVQRNYFKYVKVNLHTGCPFWPDWNQCAIKDCSVDKCLEDELPIGLKKNGKSNYAENKYSEEANTEDKGPCAVGSEESLGDVDHNISDDQREALKEWSEYDGDSSYTVDLDEDSEDAKWVDLILNPEKFTGYTGQGANRIWIAIYKENCFLPEKRMKTFAELQSVFLSKTCLEKRVFYRTMSGLHASINIDLSYNSLITDPRFPSKPQWGPDLDDFERRFDPVATKGNGPHWLKNLYFTYLLTLRAVTKAAPYWKEAVFFTGHEKEDKEVKQIILELIKSSKTCPSTFDETQMFTGDPQKANALKEEFRLHFKNVTRIMDCVGCEKCRLWGKLQTHGLATAMKILFSSDKWDKIPVINGKRFSLRRTEIVGLFNVLNKLSHSVHYIGEFKKMSERKNRKEL